MTSAKITPDIQIQRLRDLGTSPAGPLYQFAVKIGARVQTQAARNLSGLMVKVRTGNLRSSLSSTTEVRGTMLVETIAADASYAAAVHQGQRPHDIEPREARVLAWPGADGPAFATRVHHPGTSGKPFLTDALSEVR